MSEQTPFSTLPTSIHAGDTTPVSVETPHPVEQQATPKELSEPVAAFVIAIGVVAVGLLAKMNADR